MVQAFPKLIGNMRWSASCGWKRAAHCPVPASVWVLHLPWPRCTAVIAAGRQSSRVAGHVGAACSGRRRPCGSNGECATEVGMTSAATGEGQSRWPRSSSADRSCSPPPMPSSASANGSPISRRTMPASRAITEQFPHVKAILLGIAGGVALSVRSDPRRCRACIAAAALRSRSPSHHSDRRDLGECRCRRRRSRCRASAATHEIRSGLVDCAVRYRRRLAGDARHARR